VLISISAYVASSLHLRATLSSLCGESAEKTEKFKAILGIDASFLASRVVLISDSFLISQISGDNGKHSAMICELCLKKLNSTYWLRARMRIAEESYFVFYRN
jgi:hypothetical protein